MKPVRFYFLLALLGITSIQTGFAQGARPPGRSAEQLKQDIAQSREQLRQAASDTAKARIGIELASHLGFQDADAAIEEITTACSRAEKSKHAATLLNTYTNAGGILQRLGRMDDALEYLKKGLPHIEKARQPRVAGICYGSIAQIYMRQGVYEKALQYYQKSLAEFEKHAPNPDYEAMTFQQIGNIHMRTGQPAEAVSYFQRAAAIWEKTQSWGPLEGCYRNLGNAYQLMQNTAEASAAFEKAGQVAGKFKKKG